MAPEQRRVVGVLTVSYNTRDLTALLLWSLRSVVARRPVAAGILGVVMEFCESKCLGM